MPAVLRAQSGRRQPGVQPTPSPQRPRRAPATTQDPQPGQPSTPDAPSTTVTPRVTPAPAVAGSSAEPAIEDDEVYRVESNLVPVSANVSDAATGRAVIDLKADDFELRVDGQPKPISDISFSETPVRLALLFDNSSSIRPTRELEKHAAAGFFRKVLRPVDQGAIFSIATYPTLDQQLTSDVSKLVRTVEGYGDVENSTALFDTIVMAAEYLQPQPGRKVIVIVSDGVETTSRLTDFGEVVRRVLAARSSPPTSKSRSRKSRTTCGSSTCSATTRTTTGATAASAQSRCASRRGPTCACARAAATTRAAAPAMSRPPRKISPTRLRPSTIPRATRRPKPPRRPRRLSPRRPPAPPRRNSRAAPPAAARTWTSTRAASLRAPCPRRRTRSPPSGSATSDRSPPSRPRTPRPPPIRPPP
ncbi:MAG: hypothetical protein LC800_07335 [Acidobacteria bacterium]|nr:hypothetical protein [Acidobacteriota bacterium]